MKELDQVKKVKLSSTINFVKNKLDLSSRTENGFLLCPHLYKNEGSNFKQSKVGDNFFLP